MLIISKILRPYGSCRNTLHRQSLGNMLTRSIVCSNTKQMENAKQERLAALHGCIDASLLLLSKSLQQISPV